MAKIKNWSKLDETKINSGDIITVIHAWKHSKSDNEIHIMTNSYKKGYQVSIGDSIDSDVLQFDILKVGYDFAINYMKCHPDKVVLREKTWNRNYNSLVYKK